MSLTLPISLSWNDRDNEEDNSLIKTSKQPHQMKLLPLSLRLAGLVLFCAAPVSLFATKDAEPTIDSVSINGEKQESYDLSKNHIKIRNRIRLDPRLDPAKILPQVVVKASSQSLIDYSTFVQTVYPSYYGKDTMGNLRDGIGFRMRFRFPVDAQKEAWPNYNADDTSLLVVWLDPSNASELNAATLLFMEENTNYEAAYGNDFYDLNIPATIHQAGTREPRGYPVVLACKNGEFLKPTASAQAYRFAPPPASESDAAIVSRGLQFAAQNGFTDYLRTYINSFPKGESPVNSRFKNEYAQLAAQSGRSKTLEYLISIGTDPQETYLASTSRFAFGTSQMGTRSLSSKSSNLVIDTLKSGHTACTLAILKSLDHEPRDLIQNSVVAKAIEFDEFDFAQSLLSLGYSYQATRSERKQHIQKCKDSGFSDLAAAISEKREI